MASTINAATSGGGGIIHTADSSGTLTLQGAGTTGLSISSAGATTLSAALTYGGVTLTNSVTGTGSMVLATSPTITTAALGSSTATTHSASDNSTKLATTAYVDTAISALSAVPAGSVVPYAGATEPSGWLFCYGQSLLRSTYASLFSAISTTYGAVDGTHFSLPDLRGRVAAGVDNMGGTTASRVTVAGSGITGTTLGNAGGTETHTLTTAQMPSHTHSERTADGGGGDGEINTGNPAAGTTGATGGGGAHQNTQPTMMLNYIIKT